MNVLFGLWFLKCVLIVMLWLSLVLLVIDIRVVSRWCRLMGIVFWCCNLVLRWLVLEMLEIRWLSCLMLCLIILSRCVWLVLLCVSGSVFIVECSEVSGFFNLWVMLVVNILIVLMWL